MDSQEEAGQGKSETQGKVIGHGRLHSPKMVQSAEGGKGKDKRERIIAVVRSHCQENYPADAHTSPHKSLLELANPTRTWSVHVDAPGQRHGQQSICGTGDPGVVKQGKSSRGSVDTTNTCWDPQRAGMYNGERAIGAAKGKQTNTMASCQPPPPPRKQGLADRARTTLQQLEQQGFAVAWADGSTKWQTKIGWGGYGATILGEWETCAYLPPTMKHTINRAKLRAVLVVVQQFGSANRKSVVAIDPEYTYAGLQGAAYRSRDNGWVASAGLVADVDLWQQPLDVLQSSCTIFQWVKILSHVGLHGNDVADELANRGRLMSPLHQSC